MEKKHFYCCWPGTVHLAGRDGLRSGGYVQQINVVCHVNIRVRDCLSAYPAGFGRCGDDNLSLSANGVYYQLPLAVSIC